MDTNMSSMYAIAEHKQMADIKSMRRKNQMLVHQH